MVQEDRHHLVEIEPLSGRGQAERIIVELVCPAADAAEEHCHYEPGDS